MIVEQFYTKNQFIIKTKTGTYFQSYKSMIACIPSDDNQPTILDKTYWDYSVTTSKYLFRFLHITGGRKEVMQRVKDGKIVFADLNR